MGRGFWSTLHTQFRLENQKGREIMTGLSGDGKMTECLLKWVLGKWDMGIYQIYAARGIK